jgi:hypothetical protein
MRIFALLIAFGLICCLTLPTNAQEQTSSGTTQSDAGAKVLGTVVRGNTTIVFESAGTRGVDSQKLMTWDQFAAEHPKIAATLEYKPSLISDSGYLAKHSALAAFFRLHPDIRDAMQENPGNFVAIPPRPGE